MTADLSAHLFEVRDLRVSFRSGRSSITAVDGIDYHLDAGRTGTEAWAVLRARHGDVPTLFLTADRDNELRQRLLELGVLVLYKPLKPLALRQVLQRMHGMRPAVGSGPERQLREGESSVGGA